MHLLLTLLAFASPRLPATTLRVTEEVLDGVRVVVSNGGTLRIAAAASSTLSYTVRVLNPRRWDLDSPHL